jgi:hypothetical protein
MFVQDKREFRWPEDKEWPIIYLEWTQCYVQAPSKQVSSGSNGHGSSRQFTLRGPS